MGRTVVSVGSLAGKDVESEGVVMVVNVLHHRFLGGHDDDRKDGAKDLIAHEDVVDFDVRNDRDFDPTRLLTRRSSDDNLARSAINELRETGEVTWVDDLGEAGVGDEGYSDACLGGRVELEESRLHSLDELGLHLGCAENVVGTVFTSGRSMEGRRGDSRDADLTRVGEFTPHEPTTRLLDVCIVKHDSGTLACTLNQYCIVAESNVWDLPPSSRVTGVKC